MQVWATAQAPHSYIELSITEFTIRVKNAGGKENSFITAVARDEEGSPITDYADNIRFSIESGPNGGEELDGSLAPVTKSTTAGKASVSLTSGTVSGTVRIRVEVILDGTGSGDGAPFATALTTIAIEAGDPANIVIFQDNLVEANTDGSISQTFSALAQDLHGNPVENGTVIYFGLVDNPDPAGPPYLGYKSSGTNGVANGTTTFTSAGNSFTADGLMDDDILIILEGRDEGGHRIQTVNNSTSLTLYNTLNGYGRQDWILWPVPLNWAQSAVLCRPAIWKWMHPAPQQQWAVPAPLREWPTQNLPGCRRPSSNRSTSMRNPLAAMLATHLQTAILLSPL